MKIRFIESAGTVGCNRLEGGSGARTPGWCAWGPALRTQDRWGHCVLPGPRSVDRVIAGPGKEEIVRLNKAYFHIKCRGNNFSIKTRIRPSCAWKSGPSDNLNLLWVETLKSVGHQEFLCGLYPFFTTLCDKRSFCGHLCIGPPSNGILNYCDWVWSSDSEPGKVEHLFLWNDLELPSQNDLNTAIQEVCRRIKAMARESMDQVKASLDRPKLLSLSRNACLNE